MELNHRSVCDIAVRWLKRANSAGGHGCHVAVSESQGGWNGEIPDAIGFRNEYVGITTIVVEVKVSRSDFLADKKKPHRNGEVVAMGDYRYYMCPEGLIKPDEVPDKFGLLYINSRGHVKPVISPFKSDSYFEVQQALEGMRFTESNRDRETFLLVRLLSRLGDSEKFNNMLKEARRNSSYFEGKHQELQKENRELYVANRRLKRELNALKGVKEPAPLIPHELIEN